MGGIAQAVQLKRQLGVEDVLLLEKAEDCGGTWFYSKVPLPQLLRHV
jgi:cation diffusion facilitator CzcD-associated flavoprotein CzcO